MTLIDAFRPRPRPPRRPALVALALAALVAGGSAAALLYDTASQAQDAAAPDVQGQDGPAPARRAPPKPVRKVEKPAPARPATAAAAPSPAQATQAAPPTPTAAAPDFAARLREGGAGTCAAQINAAAAASMGSVDQFNTASHWATSAADHRLVAVSLGQRYPEGGKVPFAATNVVAAPNAQGGCDAFAVQVIPSPLSCGRLRESMGAQGRQIGDLAGVPLMQDPQGQTMLVPTASETCVLVSLKIAYAK